MTIIARVSFTSVDSTVFSFSLAHHHTMQPNPATTTRETGTFSDIERNENLSVIETILLEYYVTIHKYIYISKNIIYNILDVRKQSIGYNCELRH